MVSTEESKMGGTDSPKRIRTLAKGRLARRGWVAALALGLSLGFSFMNASPASAYVGQNFLRNWETGRCLDSNASGDVYTNPCQQGNNYQTWEPIYYTHTSYDVVQVKNVATGRCLQLNAVSGALVTYWCDSGSSNQRFDAMGSWTVLQLRNWLNGNCVDSNADGSAYLLGCNGGGNQNWKLGY